MKRTELLRRLTAIATAKGCDLVFVREGAKHTVYHLGDKTLLVGRHADIPERTAKSLLALAAKATP